ncbi:MAG: serine/threonine-protein kinase [Polyangiaceae bacterium]
MKGELEEVQAPFPPGEEIAGLYTADKVIGHGASGVVYSARDRTGAPVALKVIHAELCHSKQIFGRYKREARILKKIGGDNIVRYHDFLEHGGLLVMVLELVGGTSLEAMLAAGPVSLDDGVDVMLQVCRALEVAHGAGVIHRDLKPGNVMVERDAEQRTRVRVLDFGLAKVVHGEHMITGLTERDMIFGTPEYMAPEQARGDEVDPRCDLYACGVILYEITTGTVPFRARTPMSTMTAVLTEAVEPPRVRAPSREIPPALEAVILRALAKEPEQRYPSARALADALEAALERRVISVHPRDRDEDEDLHGRDTELSLRRSQIKAAANLLEEAEKLAAERAKSAPPAPAPVSVEGAHTASWVWPLIAGVAIVTCIVLGVLLALK